MWNAAGTGALDATGRGFTGHRENRGLGLTYMNARFYVPGVGRFASADTIVPEPADPQAWNRYAYVFNSPLSLIDPDGHDLSPPNILPYTISLDSFGLIKASANLNSYTIEQQNRLSRFQTWGSVVGGGIGTPIGIIAGAAVVCGATLPALCLGGVSAFVGGAVGGGIGASAGAGLGHVAGGFIADSNKVAELERINSLFSPQLGSSITTGTGVFADGDTLKIDVNQNGSLILEIVEAIFHVSVTFDANKNQIYNVLIDLILEDGQVLVNSITLDGELGRELFGRDSIFANEEEANEH